ncbi:MAG: cytidine deaminase [Chloroflexi bacterium]|nr:cytidine deaminase [Chloroflexota bacterium]
MTEPAAHSAPHADRLLAQARAAAERAYVPYSKFRVGAAVTVGSQTFQGCNVENASYGLTVCAERVALFTAVAAGYPRVERLAVSCVDASPDLGPDGRMPCGACRQVMAELMGTDAEVIVDGAGTFRVSDLLPRAFTL